MIIQNKSEKIKKELIKMYEESIILFDSIEKDLKNYSSVFENIASLNLAAREKARLIRQDNLNKQLHLIYNAIPVDKREIQHQTDIANKNKKEYLLTGGIENSRIHAELFREKYLSWYFQSSNAIKFLSPTTYNNFIEVYQEKRSESKKITTSNYRLENYLKNEQLTNINNTDFEEEFERVRIAKNLFKLQQLIIKAIIDNFDSISFNYENNLFLSFQEANIFVAQELLDNDFIRAAGAICGVIIEKQLKQRLLPFNEKAYSLTLNTLNQQCKNTELYTETTRKRIMLYSDIRNLCDHKNNIEPTKQLVQDLIDGTKWVLTNI
jgi:hypothetical protein